jgi:hypothetical protein
MPEQRSPFGGRCFLVERPYYVGVLGGRSLTHGQLDECGVEARASIEFVRRRPYEVRSMTREALQAATANWAGHRWPVRGHVGGSK